MNRNDTINRLIQANHVDPQEALTSPPPVETGLDRVARMTGMQRQTRNVDRPVTCEACGGAWFYEVTLHRYADMYSATPGGDLHMLPGTEPTIRICVCGQPFPPNIGGMKGGRTPNSELNDFMAALNSAKAVRGEVFRELANLADAVVSKEELQAVQAQINDLQQNMLTAVNDLTSKMEALEGAKPEEPAVPEAAQSEPAETHKKKGQK